MTSSGVSYRAAAPPHSLILHINPVAGSEDFAYMLSGPAASCSSANGVGDKIVLPHTARDDFNDDNLSY